MRVTMIVPPSGFLLDDRVFPALGVLKVAAVLEQSGVDVDVLDLCGESDVTGLVEAHLETPSDAYGITATMPQMPVAAEIARQIRQARPDATLILGGPHATLMQSSARQEAKKGTPGRASKAMRELSSLFDVVVCGDGERAISLALRDEFKGMTIDGDDPKSDLFLSPKDLEETPFSARHLIDLNRYHYAIDGVRAQSLICQLGCPFGCHFCGGRRSPFLRKVRTRSAQAVIAEMRHLFDVYGTKGFMFFDDELNVNREFLPLLVEMRNLQDEIGHEFRMRGFLKAELLTEPMAEAMYAAGFRQVLVGFESGHPSWQIKLWALTPSIA